MAARTLVLLGRTGNGKSSTGNSIIGGNAFKSRMSFSSVTKECKMDSRTWKDGRLLNVIDTPGMFDTNVPKQTIDKEIVKCINLAKDGVHAVLFVCSLKNRFTTEEAEAVDNLEMLFGPTIINYMVFVFTGGDLLQYDSTTLDDYKEEFPTNLKRILGRCNSRMIVFNNHKNASPTVKEKQITELLEHVERIIAENGNQPYSNELFEKAKMMSSGLYHIKDKESLQAEQIKQLNEMIESKTRVTEDLENKLKSAQISRAAAQKEASLAKQQLQAEQKKKQEDGCTIL